MKLLIKSLLIFILIFTSCSKDDDSNSGEENPDVIEEPVITATETCLLSDFDIQENATITINCLLDLEGQTATIPSGVTFEFDGGDVFNGTLNFTSSGKIDGELLNSELILEGDVSLTSDEFNFFASRWNIVEGETTSEIAQSNNDNLEYLFEYTKSLGATTFKINKLDAYFEVGYVTSTTSDQNFYPSVESVNVPSNFNLEMTDNTHLRVYPREDESGNGGTLLAVRDVENVIISGGHLHGDRDIRYYDADHGGAGGSHLLQIVSGKDITVDGITFENGSAGSIAILSLGFTFNPDYIPSERVTVQNSTFINSRRMSIALVDGDEVDILNNKFIDNGQESTNSDGGEVGYAINVEPFRDRDENGDLREYQKVTNVLIKGNEETNSRIGFLTLTIGQDMIVEENEIDTRMVWSLVNGMIVRNNIFTASITASESWAFFGSGTGETVFNNEFSGNTITGYATGIILGTTDVEVYDNTITNVSTGIQFGDVFDSQVHDNTIEASTNAIFFAVNSSVNNVEITKNDFTSTGFYLKVAISNTDETEIDYAVLIDDNTFTGTGSVSFLKANGFIFSKNTVNGSVSIAQEVTNTLIENNTIIPTANGIWIFNGDQENIIISNNTISEPTGADRFECINNESTTPNAITLTSNTCN